MKLHTIVRLALASLILSLASLSYSSIPVQAQTSATLKSGLNPSTRLGILTVISQIQQPSYNLSQYLNQLNNSCSQHSSLPGFSQNPNSVSTPEPATIMGLALPVVLGLGLQRRKAKQ
ncbi:MAG TPA: hypothetical protein V6D21_09280 [Candidatus Obscuribacterales bacterium]